MWLRPRQTSAASGSSARISRAMIPWAGAGSITSGSSSSMMRPPSPMRCSPAAARSRAVQSPRSSFDKRVSTLPRMSIVTGRRLRCRSCARRRRLEVATTSRSSSSSSRRPLPLTRASRASPRSSTPPRASPAGSSVGRSLRLCTARSMRPSRRASSNSRVNRPVPPISGSAGAGAGPLPCGPGPAQWPGRGTAGRRRVPPGRPAPGPGGWPGCRCGRGGSPAGLPAARRAG